MTHRIRLDFAITPQPTETTCGAAVLQSVYKHFGLDVPVQNVIREVPQLPGGGTWAVYMGLDALRRGFAARIYTCDLQLFDPSWFEDGAPPVRDKIEEMLQAGVLPHNLVVQARAYLDFLDDGGELLMQEPATELVSRHLRQGVPVIAGLSCTWLYQARRERWEGEKCIPDDIRGTSTGHFVVVHGVDSRTRNFCIADPYRHRPFPGRHDYEIPIRRFFNALMLGIVTNDAKLLVIRPRDGTPHA